MDFIVVNIKEYSPTVEEAIANVEIAIKTAKKFGTKVLKIIHGYGSHGVGGAILLELKKNLPKYKKQNVIKDYISGVDWNIANELAFKTITSFPDCAQDEDLNMSNIGITIILL